MLSRYDRFKLYNAIQLLPAHFHVLKVFSHIIMSGKVPWALKKKKSEQTPPTLQIHFSSNPLLSHLNCTLLDPAIG